MKMVQLNGQFQTDKLNEAFSFLLSIQSSMAIKRMLVSSYTNNTTIPLCFSLVDLILSNHVVLRVFGLKDWLFP